MVSSPFIRTSDPIKLGPHPYIVFNLCHLFLPQSSDVVTLDVGGFNWISSGVIRFVTVSYSVGICDGDSSFILD